MAELLDSSVSCSGAPALIQAKRRSFSSSVRPGARPGGGICSHSNSERTLYLGGRDQDPRSLWDGLLSRVTLTPGTLNEEELLVSKKQITPHCLLDAQADSIFGVGAGGAQFSWENATAKPGVHSSETEALTDLCHVLINSNEFLYLH